jgi:hypothetical protein
MLPQASLARAVLTRADHGGVQTPIARLSVAESIATIAVFGYWILFENVIFAFPMEFGGSQFLLATYLLKLLLPVILLTYTGLPSPRFLLQGASGLYVWCFAAFLGWAVVPTLISGSLVDYLKLLPRFLYFIAVLALFSTRPPSMLLYAKLVIAYVLLSLCQWAGVYITQSFEPTMTVPANLTGPSGLLGNISSRFYLPSVSVPIVRLAGWWNEPSNAAASAFVGFFLARYLSVAMQQTRWRLISYLCLIAGLLTLSNAGYLALAAGLLVSAIGGGRGLHLGRIVKIVAISAMVVALFLVALYGRQYVAANMSDNMWARAIAGVREDVVETVDWTGGRVTLAQATVESARANTIGVGVQVWGEGGVIVSASAPLLWLMLTGGPGLALLAFREISLWFVARSLLRGSPSALPIVQALAVVVVQQLSYGSWMDAQYFCIVAATLALAGNVWSQQPSFTATAQFRRAHIIDR